MLNIKDCGSGYPKTFKNILDYDKHSDKYKTETDVIKEDQIHNFCLVDNTEKFEQNLQKYHKDLYFANNKERHLKLKKTNAQIEKDFYETKIMRTFRIQVNSVEINKINQGILDPEKIRKNTVAFYQKTLDKAIAILNEENTQKRKPLMVVKADVHFDQTNPHIHIHLSNFYEKQTKKNRYDQEYKKTIITSNNHQTDLIERLNNISKKIEQKQKIKISPNEIFTRLLNQTHSNQYLFLNRLHLKTAYPEFFSLYESNSLKKINVDFKNLSQKEIQKQISQIKGKWWKHDKQKYFSQINTLILKMDLIDPLEINNIKNTRVFNQLINYTFKMQMYQNLKSLGINEETQIQKFIQSDALFKFTVLQKDKVLQPNELLFKFSNEKFNLSKYDTSLKSVEDKLKSIKTQELVHYFEKEYQKVKDDLELNQETQKVQEFKKETLAFSFDEQKSYIEKTSGLLNQTQQLGFENLLEIIALKNEWEIKTKERTLENNLKKFYEHFQNEKIEVQKQLNNQLIDALDLATKLELSKDALNQYKLEKSYSQSKQTNQKQEPIFKKADNLFNFELEQKIQSLEKEVKELRTQILNEELASNYEIASVLEQKKDNLVKDMQKLNKQWEMVIEYPTNSNDLNQKITQLNNGYNSTPFYEQVVALIETNHHNFDNDYELMINERKAEQLSSLERAWKEQALRQTLKEHEMKQR